VGERCQPQAEIVDPASGSGRIATRGERLTKVNPRLAIRDFSNWPQTRPWSNSSAAGIACSGRPRSGIMRP
jgi:crotonobetainyl-CoA:carnitine CoA-transferase CaiB-like acyl-CoA transferase